MVLVNNTKLSGVQEMEEDTSKDKNDATDVKYTSNGKGYGVLAVVIY